MQHRGIQRWLSWLKNPPCAGVGPSEALETNGLQECCKVMTIPAQERFNFSSLAPLLLCQAGGESPEQYGDYSGAVTTYPQVCPLAARMTPTAHLAISEERVPGVGSPPASSGDLSCSPGVSLLVVVNPRFGISFGLEAEDGLPDSIVADDQDVITEAVRSRNDGARVHA